MRGSPSFVLGGGVARAGMPCSTSMATPPGGVSHKPRPLDGSRAPKKTYHPLSRSDPVSALCPRLVRGVSLRIAASASHDATSSSRDLRAAPLATAILITACWRVPRAPRPLC